MNADQQPIPPGPGHRALVRETRNARRSLAHQLIDEVPDDGSLDEVLEALVVNQKLRSRGDA